LQKTCRIGRDEDKEKISLQSNSCSCFVVFFFCKLQIRREDKREISQKKTFHAIVFEVFCLANCEIRREDTKNEKYCTQILDLVLKFSSLKNVSQKRRGKKTVLHRIHVVFECFNFAIFSLLLANNNLWRFISPFGLSQGLACSRVAVIIKISCDSFRLEHWFKHAWVCWMVQEQESERAHPRLQPIFAYRFMDSFVREPLSIRPSHMPWGDFRPNSRKWISQQDCKLFKLK
jgi:hypothetical protein